MTQTRDLGYIVFPLYSLEAAEDASKSKVPHQTWFQVANISIAD